MRSRTPSRPVGAKASTQCAPRSSVRIRQRLWQGIACITLGALQGCSLYPTQELIIDRSIQAQSQNSRVEFIVLHYTATGWHSSLELLSRHNVSAHYLVTDETPPRIFQLVSEDRRAWHAGESQWYGRSYLNASSIGIEIVNRGAKDGVWAPYPPQQIATVAALVRDIAQRHQVKPQNIVGHSDVAPQRKLDPGPAFPWETLARAGIGRWFDSGEAHIHLAQFQNAPPDMAWVQTQLDRLGYAVPRTGELDLATRNVIAAFQMHYRPARHDGNPDLDTLSILRALK